MRCYKINWEEPNTGTHVEWCATRQKAVVILRNKVLEMSILYRLSEREYRKRYNTSIELVDIPTRRDELIAWLNTHYAYEND